MTSTFISRTQRGVPSGGRFTLRSRMDGIVGLDDNAAAKSLDTSTAELERLARHADGRIRASVASNINLSTATLRDLSLDEDYGVRYFLLTNPCLKGLDVEHLTHDPNATIRLAALNHENLPSRVQQSVMNRQIESELYSLASNRGASVSFLDKLGRDVSPMIRGAVAGNPSTRPSVLTTLLSDSDSLTRTAATANPSTPALSPAV